MDVGFKCRASFQQFFCSLESQILVKCNFSLIAARINNWPGGKDSGLEVVAVLFKSRAS